MTAIADILGRARNLLAFALTRSGRGVVAIERENAQLREQLAQRVLDETFIVDMLVDKGALTLGTKGGAAAVFAEWFAADFARSGAENYVEISFASRHRMPGEEFLVTVQRKRGQTPHQLRVAAESKLARLSASIPHQALGA